MRGAWLFALVMSLLASLVGAIPAGAYAGAPWFEPSKPYNQNFPDPSVLRVGSTYYAYGTSTGGAYLPVMTSTDLATWVARPAYDPGAPLNRDRYFNDALPYPARWGVDRPGVSGRMTKEVWSPGVERIGGRYVAFYTVRVELGSPGRFCISVATSSSPLGPFVDDSTGPLVCDSDPAGSIDPQPFVDADGTPYLLWKSEGIPGRAPTKIWSRRLTPEGTSFAPGSSPAILLQATESWEAGVIENPSMLRSGGALVLFYSANHHTSAAYATGYATCAGPLGPCTKRTTGGPLLGSHGARLGPGGPSAFSDTSGSPWLAFHWWNAPYTTYPAYPQCQSEGTCHTQGQRRMSVERISIAGDGTVRMGSSAATPTGGLNAPAVSMAAHPSGAGYWIATADGGVFSFGRAPFAGSAGGVRLNQPMITMAAHPSGNGYWLVARDGGVFTYGAAPFHGSTGAMRLNQPVVAMAPSPTGAGYWFTATDGGVFTFGDARFFGSTGGLRLNQPVLAMASTRSGNGYWLAARDGGIFTFGDAGFFGSTGDIRLNQPIVGMATTPSGRGYWLVAADGGIFTFGDARFFGSTGSLRLVQPIVSMAATPTGGGYWMTAADGGVFAFGDAAYYGRPGA